VKPFSLPLNADIDRQDSHNVSISVAKINLYNLGTVQIPELEGQSLELAFTANSRNNRPEDGQDHRPFQRGNLIRLPLLLTLSLLCPNINALNIGLFLFVHASGAIC